MGDKTRHLPLRAILPLILYAGSGIKSDITEQPYLKKEMHIYMYWGQI
jgi:hypothetical protein